MRMRKLLRTGYLIALVSVLIIGMMIYIFFSDLSSIAAGNILRDYGISIADLKGVKPGLTSLKIDRAVLERNEDLYKISLDLKGAELFYSLTAGRISAFKANECTVMISEKPGEKSVGKQGLFVPRLPLQDYLPKIDLDIKKLELSYRPDTGDVRYFSGLVRISHTEEGLAGTIRSETGSIKEAALNFGLETGDKIVLSVVDSRDHELIDLEGTAASEDGGLRIQGSVILKEQLAEFLSTSGFISTGEGGEFSLAHTLKSGPILPIENSFNVHYDGKSFRTEIESGFESFLPTLKTLIDHDLMQNRGKASIETSSPYLSMEKIDFSLLGIDDLPLEVSDGELRLRAEFSWGSGLDKSAILKTNVKEVSVILNKAVIDNLGGSAVFDLYDSFKTVDPVVLSAENVSYGFSLTDVNTQFHLRRNAASTRLEFTEVAGGFADGTVHSGPFIFRLPGGFKTDVEVKSLSLKRLLEQYPQPNLSVTGRLSGTLPLRWNDKGFTIEDGVLTAESPGGEIRYQRSDREEFYRANPQMAFVFKALENTYYDSLKAVINYSPDGDLTVDLEIKGQNPQLSETRPLNLNITIEENILTLLGSMKMTRGFGR